MLKKLLLGTVVAAVAGIVIGTGVASERVGNDVAHVGEHAPVVAKDDHPLLDHEIMRDHTDVSHANEGHGPAGVKDVAHIDIKTGAAKEEEQDAG